MKRFRFALGSYLRLLHQQLAEAEAQLEKLRAQQRECFEKADELRAQFHSALARNTGESILDGSVLASLDRWRTTLAQHCEQALRDANALQGPLLDAMTELQSLRQRVELVERLRERRLNEHQRQRDREAEQVAAELYLGNLHRRGG